MDLGVHLPLMQLGHEALSSKRLVEVVDAARECGFAAVSANDHFVFETPWLDGPTALASMIERSGEMTLATTVSLAALRGPVPLAKTLAALDLLSEGRLIAALGPGSSGRDYEALGLAFEERWGRFEEAVVALRALLNGGPRPETARYWPLPSDLDLEPAPCQREGVPLWIGSWGSKVGLRRVARLADGWLASAYNTTPERFAESRDLLSAELVARDRSTEGFQTLSRRCGPGSRRIGARPIGSWPKPWRRCCGAIPTSWAPGCASDPSRTARSSSPATRRPAASTSGRWETSELRSS